MAVCSITLLQQGAAAGRDAQLRLAKLETALTQLQVAPFRASPRTGGSPVAARTLMDDKKQQVGQTLADLRRSSPVPALAEIAGPLRANFSSLEEIYAIGVSGADYGLSLIHI